MYHAVGVRTAAHDPHNLFVPPDTLRRQLGSLLERGWRPLTLTEYLRGDGPRRSVLVTFDDGYQPFLEEGLPVLRELGVPATVFVLSGLLGGRSRWMPEMPDEPLVDADGVRELAAAGLDVECHGWDHPRLPGVDARTLALNVTEAARVLAGLTGRRPLAYAYPYGDHDAAARRAVAEAGFRVAFAVHEGAGRFAVPRVDITSIDTDVTFRLKTWRVYPAMRRLSGRVPAVRSGLHSLIGRAPRP
ncbi:polysaccharide deacetylase family protein [Streptomyces sp. XM83C]|jgi:peptidoglycan/xylan/chitin deacetylase (PgdA/CDA1 family)|uniref:Polysaccharide deacetylase family protein n=1 Tax=Streptomyces thermocoprophilus TaxID=78356 RepID=A0ABV5V7Z2_9ACTN|nr:polysaccharide deacetylase family protein [Streptomyces sp. XM83C]MCK1818417.1 polysaccharide deacetylase family protein [Streptomyces sp. XM83C]